MRLKFLYRVTLLINVGFNPRICKRCDALDEFFAKKAQVSIHASVKDATGGWLSYVSQKTVSIHASVKDATSLFPYGHP